MTIRSVVQEHNIRGRKVRETKNATFALLHVLGVQRFGEQTWEKGPYELAHDPDLYL